MPFSLSFSHSLSFFSSLSVFVYICVFIYLQHCNSVSVPTYVTGCQLCQALLELLSASGLQQFDQARLLRLAHQAHFYRVCQLVYTKTKQYAKIVDCYLLDTARQQQVWYPLSLG